MNPVVVKLGGDVLGAPASGLVAHDLKAALDDGHRLVIVHGGGPQATALSKRLGNEPHIVAGRRVTDEAALDVMKMVVAGRLNVDIVAALAAAGVAAVGLHGAGGVIRATRRPARVVSGAGDLPIDLGLVGDVESFDLNLLAILATAGRVPVLACLAGSAAGQTLNINADVVASRLAVALTARALVAVTAVGGVRRNKDDASSCFPRLTAAQAREAIASGAVQGGMIPKLEEAVASLEAGVPEIHIVGPGEVAASLRAPGTVGTWLGARHLRT